MTKRLSTNEFIERAKKIHVGKWDYSKVEYVNANTKVCIVCPEHGEFWQLPATHLKSYGCPICSKEIKFNKFKSNTENFINKAKKIHGDKYDYSKVNYVNSTTKVCIICPEHGEFWQVPYYHLAGNGCQVCANKSRKNSTKTKKTTKEFINECTNIYGKKYDYSKVEYVNAHTKVCIIDVITGEEIMITPTTLLTKGVRKKKKNITSEDWIKMAKEVHGDKYDYSKTVYNGKKNKIIFKCPKHGFVEQLPNNHIKYGCGLCGKEEGHLKRTKDKCVFIEECKKVHGDKYDYSKVDYVNGHEKVCIICPKHGEFWQSPEKHLYSSNGCPKCKTSKLEEEIMVYLENNNIDYIFQYSPDFLKNGKGRQKLDFYLPKYNTAIECQGIQHFTPSRFSALSLVELNKKRDIVKYERCIENGVNILYYTTSDNILFKNECQIYTDNNIFCVKEDLFLKLREVL